MAVGGLNPLPLVIGGAASNAEKVHAALRSAMGGREGGGTGKHFWEGSIEDAWRFAKARAIAYVLGLEEQAIEEFLPHHASYNVDQWEESLGLEPAASLNERRLQIAAKWTDEIDVIVSGLQADLRARFASTTLTLSTDSARDRCQGHYHKWLADRSGVLPFGPRSTSPAPGFSTAYRLRVYWPGTHDEREMQLMRDRLNDVLPSWWDYSIFEDLGFEVGTSKVGHVAVAW